MAVGMFLCCTASYCRNRNSNSGMIKVFEMVEWAGLRTQKLSWLAVHIHFQQGWERLHQLGPEIHSLGDSNALLIPMLLQ